MKFIGIDPGLSGAIALFDPNGEIRVLDMPTFEITVNGKKKRQIDMHQLASIAKDFGGVADAAIIEQVSAMPKQGVTSMFNFGFAAGAAHMAIVACGIPLSTVTSMKWKKALGLSRDKDASRRLASRKFPKHAHLWPLVKHDGRAEAVLLAYYLSTLSPSNDDIFS